MRARNIKPGYFKNDLLAECQPLARLLFAGLWCLADREGRLEDRPARIKAEHLPYDACDVGLLLGELEAGGFIRRYEVAGRRCIVVAKFCCHQKPHSNEQPSTLPPPPKASTGNAPGAARPAPAAEQSTTKVVPCNDQGSAEQPPGSEALGPDSLLSDCLLSESLTTEETDAGASVCPETATPSSGPAGAAEAVMTFPCDGKPKTWTLTAAQAAEWQAAFPTLDVRGECRKAGAWLDADPTRRKTARGMKRFLVGWLGRAQNRRGPPPVPAANGHARGRTVDDVIAECRKKSAGSGV